MSASDLTGLLARLEVASVVVRVADGGLDVTGSDLALTDELIEELRRLKPDLLAIGCGWPECGSVDLNRYDPDGRPLCEEHGAGGEPLPKLEKGTVGKGEETSPDTMSGDVSLPAPIPPAPRAQCPGDRCTVEVPEGQQCRPCAIKAVDAWLKRRDGPLARSTPTTLSSGELADTAKRGAA